jgi:hypothetical protein
VISGSTPTRDDPNAQPRFARRGAKDRALNGASQIVHHHEVAREARRFQREDGTDFVHPDLADDVAMVGIGIRFRGVSFFIVA